MNVKRTNHERWIGYLIVNRGRGSKIDVTGDEVDQVLPRNEEHIKS